PDRQADEPGARLLVEPGPLDHRRFVRVMRIEQQVAEGDLVQLTARSDRAGNRRRPAPRGRVGGRDNGFLSHRAELLSPPAAPAGAVVDLPGPVPYIAASAQSRQSPLEPVP